MSLETQSLEFGEFFLDQREKVLLRNGDRLPINPKTYQMLVTLIENHGHLIEKERLMEILWANSFVEDANLAFTVSAMARLRSAIAFSRKPLCTAIRQRGELNQAVKLLGNTERRQEDD